MLVASACLLFPTVLMAKNVLIETPLGNIEIELLEEDAPKTVANFLKYLTNDRYTNTFIHRSVPGFVIQGGGFIFTDGAVTAVETFPELENEFKISNTRGTLAMAKRPGEPDSASSQWFINVGDNSASLDPAENGAFTVFARVVGDGMDVVDAINSLTIWNASGVFGGAFSEMPLIDFVNDGRQIAEEHIVMTAVSENQTAEPFVMNAGLNDAWFNPDTNGQGFFITVFPELKFVTIAWFTYDTDLPTDDETANLGDPGHRWITAGGVIEGNRAVMDINVTSGGLFDNEREVQNTEPVGADGTITLTFDDCAVGLVEYDITSIDQQGSVPIQRVAADNEALCLALLAPAEN
jgi:cyclophilin family peptidyl-prolyl cis-trans isomerase